MNAYVLVAGAGLAGRLWRAACRRPWLWLVVLVGAGVWFGVAGRMTRAAGAASAEMRTLARYYLAEARPPLRGRWLTPSDGGLDSAETWQRTQQLAAAAAAHLRAQGILPTTISLTTTITYA